MFNFVMRKNDKEINVELSELSNFYAPSEGGYVMQSSSTYNIKFNFDEKHKEMPFTANLDDVVHLCLPKTNMTNFTIKQILGVSNIFYDKVLENIRNEKE